MNRLESTELEVLEADLILLHAPSVFDFRERDDLLFAYLSDSDSVNVTSIYEMYPIGFLVMKQHLERNGFVVKIVNLASLMLMHPDLNVDKLLSCLQAPIIGLDLHWMTQCHGAIEVARRLRVIQPDVLTIMGGLSSTYYAQELITYDAVDVVVRGFDTLAPLTSLMQHVQQGSRDFKKIPNLLYKDTQSNIVDTGFSHKPTKNYNDESVDWGFFRDVKADPKASKLIMTLPNTGCAYDCPWCGGSRYAYRNFMDVKRTLITKDHNHIVNELRSMGEAASKTTIYALQCYSETKTRQREYLDTVKEMGYRSVSFEQFHLTDDETMRKMADSTQAYIMLSPESHDREISKLSGRGTYSMSEMEDWIERALDIGIKGIVIWFFIGMPKQTPQSVMDSTEYCISLLQKFRGKNVIPLICPMVPFLDPGSRLFEEPKKHGYHIFHRTLEEHRQAMIEPLWYKRLNYETKWMSRKALQDVSYKAVATLVQAKAEYGFLPKSFAKNVVDNIDETTRMLAEIEDALEQDGRLPQSLRQEILTYNRRILSFSSDQIIPLERPFGGRWFDDFTVPESLLASLT